MSLPHVQQINPIKPYKRRNFNALHEFHCAPCIQRSKGNSSFNKNLIKSMLLLHKSNDVFFSFFFRVCVSSMRMYIILIFFLAPDTCLPRLWHSIRQTESTSPHPKAIAFRHFSYSSFGNKTRSNVLLPKKPYV